MFRNVNDSHIHSKSKLKKFDKEPHQARNKCLQFTSVSFLNSSKTLFYCTREQSPASVVVESHVVTLDTKKHSPSNEGECFDETR